MLWGVQGHDVFESDVCVSMNRDFTLVYENENSCLMLNKHK